FREDTVRMPENWECPERLIHLGRFRRIWFGLILVPACPTRSTFEPLLRSAQSQGLAAVQPAKWVDTLATIIAEANQLKELDVTIDIVWKMMDTRESVKNFDLLMQPLYKLKDVGKMHFSICDAIDREDPNTQAKLSICTETDKVVRAVQKKGTPE